MQQVLNSRAVAQTTTANQEQMLVKTFASDVQLRKAWFLKQSFGHPAKMNLHLLLYLVKTYTKPGDTILDPMAGVGSILLAALSGRHVIARELEPKFVKLLQRNAFKIRSREEISLFATELLGQMDVGQANARLPFDYLMAAQQGQSQGQTQSQGRGQVDHIIFSPTYGCRTKMLTWDTPKGREKLAWLAAQPGKAGERWAALLNNVEQHGSYGSLCFTYGEEKEQIGHLRGHGKAYWQAMEQVYTNCFGALKPGGRMIVVLKDYIYKGNRVEMCNRTIKLCQQLGFSLEERWGRDALINPTVWTRNRAAKGEPVVEVEEVLVFSKPDQSKTKQADLDANK